MTNEELERQRMEHQLALMQSFPSSNKTDIKTRVYFARQELEAIQNKRHVFKIEMRNMDEHLTVARNTLDHLEELIKKSNDELAYLQNESSN